MKYQQDNAKAGAVESGSQRVSSMNRILEPGAVRIIVIGGSAGSLPALRVIISEFPTDFGAAIFVVEHVSPHLPCNLPKYLSQEGTLPVRFATDQEPIAPGRIYVAPRDEHMVLDRGRVRLQRSPKEPWNRPAINILFRSAAAAYGSSVAGVVLSGMLSDGTAGLWEIKNAGGMAIVQDTGEAEYPEMPLNALQNVQVDYCLPAASIGSLLIELVGSAAANAWRVTGQSPRIMVVEDEAAQAIDLECQLHSLGYDVVACVSTGEEALRAARELPALALVDIRLSGKLDGIETAEILTSRFKIPVIYTTSYDDDETIRRLKRTRPSGYLGKPIRPKDLHGAIEVTLSARGVAAGNPE
jgi:chemotaxis response regulator CheB